jgi:hypothetical protein
VQVFLAKFEIIAAMAVQVVHQFLAAGQKGMVPAIDSYWWWAKSTLHFEDEIFSCHGVPRS